MKRILILEAVRLLSRSKTSKRKLKAILSVAFLGIVLSTALALWAGSAVATSIADLGRSPELREQMAHIKREARALPAIAKEGCWQKIQSLMSPQPWLEKPIPETLGGIKSACIAEKS